MIKLRTVHVLCVSNPFRDRILLVNRFLIVTFMGFVLGGSVTVPSL